MMNKLSINFISVAVIASNMFLFAGCVKNCDKKAAVAQPAVSFASAERQTISEGQPEPDPLEEKWGIKVESARLSAGGYMIDFRYRVLDAAKAVPILDRKTKPYLIDQATGATFIVPDPPKVGQLRSRKNIKEGKIYFIFFANPGQYVKQGNKATVVIGECKITDIVVQ